VLAARFFLAAWDYSLHLNRLGVRSQVMWCAPDQCFKTRRSLLSPVRGRMLVTTFRSPATAAPFEASIPRSTFLACHFASQLAASTARSAFLLCYPVRLAPVWADRCFGPVAVSTACSKTAPPTSTPLQDFYLPPDQSVQLDLLSFGPPSDSARFPFAPRRRFLSARIYR
jgi:hypothetical protein